MTLHRKLLAVAVAGALAAATAVPALALENEFHGTIRAQYQNSNFDGTPSAQGFFNPVFTVDGKGNKVPLAKDAPTANFFDQRARLSYIAKFNDSVRLVTQFELDYSFWGNSSYTNGRNQGGAIGADTVNLETKHVFLELKPVPTTVVRVGMQPFDDAFKGVFVSADMVGAQATASCGKSTALLGFYRFNDAGGDVLGRKSRDMFALDYKYDLTKSLKVGGAYYYINDDRGTGEPGFLFQQAGNSNRIHTVGVNVENTMGPLTLDGFLLYQFGTMDAPVDRHISAYAGNVGARLKAGPGTARSEFLYVSGESSKTRGTTNAFQSVNSVDTEHGFYNSELCILGRDKYALTVDNAIIYSSNNMDQGMILGTVGYDLPITGKLTTSVNAGFAAVAKDNNALGVGHKSNYLGTEVNLEVGYKAFESVNAAFRAGYVFLGDYYKGVVGGNDPDNPYGARLLVSYNF
jgi:hypothetical protein